VITLISLFALSEHSYQVTCLYQAEYNHENLLII